ncbi:subtilase family serine protease [Kitasatospora sp. MAP12-15]|uniref:S53 family peptidase n=1 Tax=unclassified Kitasatospora TaxID=2633591 RepID=UPI002476D33E|nr:S53 family peptidase [Kitasatospora sp. MAP12-44]MDH6111566.1 subtilase family serine protease [Kitasatospora sp. MAP12-44]
MTHPTRHAQPPLTAIPLSRAAALVVATAALITYAGLPIAQADAPTTQRVGTVATAPSDAVRTAAPADNTPVQLSVHLKSRDEAGAKALAAATTDKSSPYYHHFLQTGEFAQRFGADPAAVAKVKAALTAQGLHPGDLAADGLTLPISTTVAQAKQAFSVDLAGYRLSDGSTGFLNTDAPAVRSDVAGSIVSVVGLNTLVRERSNHVAAASAQTTLNAHAAFAAPHTAAAYPQLCSGVVGAFTGKTDGKDYFSSSALASAYGLNSMTEGGAGTTVAIFALEDFSDAGLAGFQSCYGTNASVQRVKVNAGVQAPPDNNNVGVETALDLDTVIGLAPKANVLVYQGPDAANANEAAIQNTYRQIVTDNRAQVVSTSWGICDQVMATSDLQAEQDIFLQAALQGQTVVAASGDDGSSSCYNLQSAGAPPSVTNVLSASDPASQPYVTGVGGTSLTDTAGAVSETVWNSHGGASGGGVSRWAVNGSTSTNPFYQSGFVAPGYANNCQAAAGSVCRQSPDVAADADPSTGYVVSTGAGYWMLIGGTSGAAPLWAAIAAHQNGPGSCSGRVGFLNPTLYQAAKNGVTGTLRDITTGNNDVAGLQNGLYAAAPGYDMATGLGTPNADKVMDLVCAPATGSNRTVEAAENGQLHEVYTDAAGWHDTTVPGISGLSALSFTYNSTGGRVIEAIENGQLHEIYSDATGWHDGVIPGLSGITALSFSYSPGGGRVIEAIENNQLHEVYSASDGWHDGVIPGLSGISALSFSYSSGGGRVIEAIENNQLHEVYSASDGWHNGVIPGVNGISALSFSFSAAGGRVIEAIENNQLHEVYSASDGWHDGAVPGVSGITALSGKIKSTGDRVIEAIEGGQLHEVHSANGAWYDSVLPVNSSGATAVGLALH